MKIICLAENTCHSSSFGCEHGLSLYIESDAGRILFDMGQTSLFNANAKKLGVDISSVDVAVLSHGHYDHGGGLSCFLKENEKAPVYVSPYAFEPHYNGTKKYIGLDPSLENHPRLKLSKDQQTVAKGATLFSCNGYPTHVDLGSFSLTRFTGSQFTDDDFRHEQYLLLEEKGKKVLFSGCSHRGILNIIKWFDCSVIIGGFHFSKLPLNETLEEYARELNDSGITFYTCHCTGADQYSFMKQYMNKLNYLSSGQSIII